MMLNPQAPPLYQLHHPSSPHFPLPIPPYPSPYFRLLPDIHYGFPYATPPPPQIPYFPSSAFSFVPTKYVRHPLYPIYVTGTAASPYGYPCTETPLKVIDEKPSQDPVLATAITEKSMVIQKDDVLDKRSGEVHGRIGVKNGFRGVSMCRGVKGGCRRKVVWLPKGSADHSVAYIPFSKTSSFLEFEGAVAKNKSGEFTVIIRNIPNKYRKMLIDVLDEHCREENINLQSQSANADSLSQYDFLYLPIDFRHKGNLGYAFVNFTTVEAAKRFYRYLHGQKWKSFQSKKICCVGYARIQGKQHLVDNFTSSKFPCESEEFLPVVFAPPRDGSAQTNPVIVGRRVGGRI